MSILSVYPLSSPDSPNKVLTHGEDIAATLAEQGVHFAQWQPAAALQAGSSDEEVIAAFQAPLDQLMTERGYRQVEVQRVGSEQAELRAEHVLGGDDARFFVTGRGLFSLRIGDYVYAVLCEKNDLLVVPAGVARWVDMGEQPHFVALRVFAERDAVVAKMTGENIADDFAGLDY